MYYKLIKQLLTYLLSLTLFHLSSMLGEGGREGGVGKERKKKKEETQKLLPYLTMVSSNFQLILLV